MRRMSFFLTPDRVRRREKTVTRRIGWVDLEPGTQLLAVQKAMGLKKGERHVPLATIRVVDVRRERLDELVNPARGDYGVREMEREGFPGMDPQDFLLMFVDRIDPDDLVTRIEFEYVDPPPARLAGTSEEVAS